MPVLALIGSHCATLGKLLNLPEFQLPHLLNGVMTAAFRDSHRIENS